MTLLGFFEWLNGEIIGPPGTILFLGSAIILSIKTGLIQLRGFPTFLRIIFGGDKCKKKGQFDQAKSQTISPMRALFSALAQSIGMGSIVGPTVAIMKGGPGALFWLLVYIFLASATKFTEVTFALQTREKTPDGYVIGGPMQYLKLLHPFLALWYGSIMAALFMIWSGLQSNTLAAVFALESVPSWLVGVILSGLALATLSGGVKRVGQVASKLVPLMFFLYVTFAIYVLSQNPLALKNALLLLKNSIFRPASLMGGFWGASVFLAIRYGVFRGMLISEAGMGTASIPHAVSDTKTPVNQGLLAMGSVVSDLLLSTLSGLLVLVTGAWIRGEERPTLIYEVFKEYAPFAGQIVLIVSISLFILTTIIANSFNGSQSFASLTRHRWVKFYIAATGFIIFLGTLVPVALAWQMVDTFLFAAAVPNLIGLLYLAFKYPQVLRLKNASV